MKYVIFNTKKSCKRISIVSVVSFYTSLKRIFSNFCYPEKIALPISLLDVVSSMIMKNFTIYNLKYYIIVIEIKSVLIQNNKYYKLLENIRYKTLKIPTK